MTRKILCNRHDCAYSSLGGWCQLGQARYHPDDREMHNISCHILDTHRNKAGE